MICEGKISLPLPKQAYAIFFAVVISLVRGVTYTYEIGIALEAPMAILAASFCADTYTQEITSKRSEIQRLYPMKKRIAAIYKRIALQELFLFAVAAIAYGLFYVFQNPQTAVAGPYAAACVNPGCAQPYECGLFLGYLAAVAVTLVFWGLLSNLLACLFRNMWTGLGCCLLLWLMADSTAGNRCLGVWNLFSYTFRNITDDGDMSWLCGKAACIGIAMAAVWLLPKVIVRRG